MTRRSRLRKTAPLSIHSGTTLNSLWYELVWTYCTSFQQVLFNLLFNAVKDNNDGSSVLITTNLERTGMLRVRGRRINFLSDASAPVA